MCAFYREKPQSQSNAMLLPSPLSNTHSMRQEMSRPKELCPWDFKGLTYQWSSPAHISPRADSSSLGSAPAPQLGRGDSLHPQVGGRECLVHQNPSLCHPGTLIPRLGTGGWAAAHMPASLSEASGDQQALGELAQTCITPTTQTPCGGSDLTGLGEGTGGPERSSRGVLTARPHTGDRSPAGHTC